MSRSSCETVAVAGDCLIVILEEKLSILGVNSIRRGLELLGSEYEQVGYVSCIKENCASADVQTRELMADVVRRHTTRIGAAAMVVSGEGFRSTLVRSVLTGIHLASGATHPLRTFSALDPALAWYERKRPRRKLGLAALREAVIGVYPPAAQTLR
ncbi:MAG TPA: hypothetical protein VG963_05485 [Polyangiaceae bacterium]|nr:hypothetical protein [Polyangiaceae bacterium]